MLKVMLHDIGILASAAVDMYLNIRSTFFRGYRWSHSSTPLPLPFVSIYFGSTERRLHFP
jgi:hypothetical protein